MTHLAIAFAIAHPGVTSAIIGPRSMEQLDDLLAGAEVTLTDEILDQIDTIVPPGTNIGIPDEATYQPPARQQSNLRQARLAGRVTTEPNDRPHRRERGLLLRRPAGLSAPLIASRDKRPRSRGQRLR
jgi:hypothetical protein